MLLLNRTGLANRSDNAAEFCRELQRADVKVDVAEADIADPAQLSAAIERFCATYPDVPIRGVIHSAGVASQMSICDVSPADLRTALAAKIAGGWNLHVTFSAEPDLDFFVMHSSAVSLLPTPGLGTYAAGNAFLDALALVRRGAGLPAVSVQWGPWSGAGLAQWNGLTAMLAHLGVQGWRADQATAHLGDLLAHGRTIPACVGVIQADWSEVGRHRETLRGGDPLLENLVPPEQPDRSWSETRTPSRFTTGSRLTRSRPASEDAASIESYLREQIGQGTHVPGEQIPIDRPLEQLGIDSLFAMELILGLERDYGLRVYPREILEQPDIASLASYLGAEIRRRASGGDKESPTFGDTPLPLVLAAASPHLPVELHNGARVEPAAFVLSSPRSGSTLMRVMLAGHPDLFVPPELNLLSFAGMRERRDALAGSYLDEGLPRALAELLGTDPAGSHSLVDEMVSEDLPTNVVYERLQSLAGERLLVDKSPAYASSAATLARAEALFHEPRYVFLCRHPYAAIDSFVRARIERLLGATDADAPSLAEQIWATSNANVLDFLGDIPPERSLVVRFEDLVGRPQPTAERLCAFLGVDYDPEVLRPYEPGRMADGLHSASLLVGDPGFHSHTEIDATRGEAWQTIELTRPLGPFARRIAGELGYELRRARPAVAPTARPTLTRSPVDRRPDEGSPLVLLQPGDAHPPLFLVHPASGAVYPYYELAKALGCERPLYALQDVALGGQLKPHDTMEGYATEYVAAVRRVQPTGPYLLGGWSFGGHAAMAMAHEFRRAGEKVALLAVLDSEAPAGFSTLRRRDYFRFFCSGAVKCIGLLPELIRYVRVGCYLWSESNRHESPSERNIGLLQYARWAWSDALNRQLVGSPPLGKEMMQVEALREAQRRLSSPWKGIHLMAHHFDLVRRYRPDPYEGDMVLLRAEGQIRRRFYTTETIGWDTLVRGHIEVRTVPGDHLTLVREPNVGVVASTLRASIERALAT